MDHSTHKTDAYLDTNHKWVTFCRVCSAEGELLAEACPKKYVSVLERKEVDSKKEQD